MIHATAIVHPHARIHPSVEVGPYSIVGPDAELGEGCVLGPWVQIAGHTRIGKHNHFHASAVIGDAPQDLKYHGQPTRLIIGDHNVFREHVTLHRSNKLEEDTTIGSHCFFMAHSHLGHNSHIGNHVIVANGALIAGHVQIDDRAFISGNCLIHQFTRVGRLALMQGGAAISKDLPPFTIARGANRVSGLNVIGMRRAGLSPAERLELRSLHRLMFSGSRRWKDRLAEAEALVKTEPGRVFADFLRSTARGICSGPRHAKTQAEAGHSENDTGA